MLGKISMYIFIFSKNKVSIYIKLFATKNLLDLGLFLRKIHKISNQSRQIEWNKFHSSKSHYLIDLPSYFKIIGNFRYLPVDCSPSK